MSTPASVVDIRPANATSGAYTPQDLDKVAIIKKWLAEHDKSNAWLGKKASIPNGTLSQILALKYTASPTKQLNQLHSVLEVEEARLGDAPEGYVNTSVHQLMRVVADRSRKNKRIGVVSGYVGVGKTSFCKLYAKTVSMTLLVETNPNMTAGVFLEELLAQLNVPVPMGLDRKFREVVRVLRGTNYLLMVDEAERLSSAAMEYARRIHDKADIGIVFSGTEKLSLLLKKQHGHFDQVRSRVDMWPQTIECITRNDADDLARAALAPRYGEIDDEVLEALWEHSQGSARVLVNSLVAGVLDWSTTPQQLTAKLVDSVASKVLSMQARKARA